MRVGILDSGRGGMLACGYFRAIMPKIDTVVFSDTENAPYGNKSEGELVRLLSDGIDRLLYVGCERVLIACCTASTVHGRLSSNVKERSVPIIYPTARAACHATVTKKIAVVSTEATKRSGAFLDAILKDLPDAQVYHKASPLLVTLSESGMSDADIAYGAELEIETVTEEALKNGADTVILGCTHYAAFEKSFERLTGMRVINSARVGAFALAQNLFRK